MYRGIVYVLLPAISLIALLTALYRSGRCPAWLYALACLPSAYGVAVTVWLIDTRQAPVAQTAALGAFFAAAVCVLLWSTLSQHRGHLARWRAYLSLALPLPLASCSSL